MKIKSALFSGESANHLVKHFKRLNISSVELCRNLSFGLGGHAHRAQNVGSTLAHNHKSVLMLLGQEQMWELLPNA